MIEERLALAWEQFAEDPVLTQDLTDDAAAALLGWAQERVRALVAATHSFDAAMAWAVLEPALHILRFQVRELSRRSADAEDPLAALRASLAILDGIQHEEESGRYDDSD